MNEKQRADLAAKVRGARKARGWSQERLAKEAGVAANTVLHIEKAKRDPHPGTLRKVLDTLGFPPAARVLDLEGVPENVSIFLSVALQRLSVMPEDECQRVLNDVYPRLLGSRSGVDVPSVRVPS